MNTANTLRKQIPWGVMAILAIGVTIAAAGPYMTFSSANFNQATAHYATGSWVSLAGLYTHIIASGLALLLGPFQFLRGLRQLRPLLHRWMGRVYLVSVLLGGLAALLIAPTMISGLVGAVGLMFLAVLWIGTGAMAYRSIRAGNVAAHREWMIRNFGLTFAAVTLRLWLGILIGTQVPFLQTTYGGNFSALFVEVYRVVMWLAWVPNLIVAEAIVQGRRGRQIAA